MSRNLWLVVLWALHCSLCVWVLLQLSKHLSFCICMYFCFSNKWHIKRLTHHTAVLVLSHLTKSDWLVSLLLHIFFFFFLIVWITLFFLLWSCLKRCHHFRLQTFDTMPHCYSVTQSLKLCHVLGFLICQERGEFRLSLNVTCNVLPSLFLFSLHFVSLRCGGTVPSSTKFTHFLVAQCRLSPTSFLF